MFSIKNMLKALGQAYQIPNKTLLALTFFYFPGVKMAYFYSSQRPVDLKYIFPSSQAYQKVYYASEDIWTQI